MKNKILGVATTGLLGTLLAFAEDGNVQADRERISLFSVPLVCEAAPEIGCGSRSKPILLELQRQPEIAEAWVNETGTVLAVVWMDASDSQARAKTVETILETNGAAGTELNGQNREIELKKFATRNNWYRGAEVDNLSKREAAIIAARLVRRVQAKVALSEEKAQGLATKLAQVIQDRFISEARSSKLEFYEEVMKVVRENLDERGVAAFQEAIAKGYRPQAEDNEGTKTQKPSCCSAKAG
jgi:hypothetical protein